MKCNMEHYEAGRKITPCVKPAVWKHPRWPEGVYCEEHKVELEEFFKGNWTKTCRFVVAWVGQCPKEAYESGFCVEHAKRRCDSCGAQATHDCDETGQLVCGAPLCDECEHLIFPEGHNGGVGFNQMPLPEGCTKRHVKKTEQKFKNWYMQETEKQNVETENKG